MCFDVPATGVDPAWSLGSCFYRFPCRRDATTKQERPFSGAGPREYLNLNRLARQ